MQGILKIVLSGLGMLVLIIDSKAAIKSASEGITLCIQTLIPSLFPFMFLSGMLTGALTNIRFRSTKGLCRLMKIPQGSLPTVFISTLGGYPVGAYNLTILRNSNALSENDCQRMLAFCNNCGPAFLFGIVSRNFQQQWMVWIVWAVHILSAFLVALVMPGSPGKFTQHTHQPVSAPHAMRSSIAAMGQVCGWIILFRILIDFLGRWFGHFIPNNAYVIISGLLELSNGCLMLDRISDIGLRFILCCGLITFGGLCVTMQTIAVAGSSIHTGRYLPGKLLQTGFSLVLSGALSLFFTELYIGGLCIAIGLAMVAVFTIFLKFSSKRGSILQPVGV